MCPPTCLCFPPPCCPSSRTLKRNIKPFKDYEKSLKDIAVTPLFTYQYKKGKGDHPEKPRMGIISEELPKNLQIRVESGSDASCETDKKRKDSQAENKTKKKDGEKISTPDWLSIYGTLWAGIKAFAKQLEDFKRESAARLTELSRELKAWLTGQMDPLKKEAAAQVKELKSQTAEVEKALAKRSKELAGDTRELSKLKKQLEKNILPLQENLQEELKKTKEEMKDIKKQLKQNLSFHSTKKTFLTIHSG